MTIAYPLAPVFFVFSLTILLPLCPAHLRWPRSPKSDHHVLTSMKQGTTFTTPTRGFRNRVHTAVCATAGATYTSIYISATSW
ncbi:hypothetical protein PAXRUDRAFT_828547 [Paxillus rubicundulus Ve08.2h10]|uniref:Uncharacterized protein n=1 Tax=Paxillus rubicundulus Ve08.2h10 TaxID=930991 RepID=A0A0D0E152_9AGAM|nr:hypothetical protein PAXRUDRAFT_828547 [Paxillus rubicundulus Ve08.2h10]